MGVAGAIAPNKDLARPVTMLRYTYTQVILQPVPAGANQTSARNHDPRSSTKGALGRVEASLARLLPDARGFAHHWPQPTNGLQAHCRQPLPTPGSFGGPRLWLVIGLATAMDRGSRRLCHSIANASVPSVSQCTSESYPISVGQLLPRQKCHAQCLIRLETR